MEGRHVTCTGLHVVCITRQMRQRTTTCCCVPPVVCVHVVDQVLPVDGADVLLRAQDGAAQGGVLEGSRVQVVKHQLTRLLVHLFGCVCGCVCVERASGCVGLVSTGQVGLVVYACV